MAKKKVKKRDFSKAKEKAIKALKISVKALIAIIGITITAAFLVVPFLHNKIDAVVAKCIWYPASIVFAASAIVNMVKQPKQSVKYPIFDFIGNLGIVPIIVILGSAFVINYYDSTYTWWWAIFVLIALFLPVFTFGMRNFLKEENKYTEEQLKASLKICCKYVGFYWLMDLFYMAIFNYWIADEQSQSLWLIMQFVFGGLAMVYIFYNLARVFLSNAQKRWWGLLQDFLWGIAITIYLIFLISNDALQTIVLSITAAVYGGLLTLVGVAWTIKDTNEKRKEDLLRVENERKEEERKKHIPYIRVSFDMANLPPVVVNANITKGLDFEKKEDLTLLKNKVFYSVNIKNFDIKNISSQNIIIKGIIVHGKFYEFSSEEILEPNVCCKIQTTNNWWIPVAHPTDKLTLIVSDVIGNLYEIECHISYDIETSRHQVATVGDEEYTGFEYSYIVTSVGLPIFIPR